MTPRRWSGAGHCRSSGCAIGRTTTTATKFVVMIALLATAILSLAWVADARQRRKEQPVDMVAFFEKRLSAIAVLSPEQVRDTALMRTFPDEDGDRIWDSLVKVVVQNGIIVNASRETGLLVAVTDFVTNPGVQAGSLSGGTTALCNTIYVLVDVKQPQSADIWLKADKPLNRVFFDALATQVYARRKLRSIIGRLPEPSPR